MRTVITDSVEEAAGFVKRRGICAFPTETVYGLGANVFDDGAVARIFEAKGRPADNPLIAHVSEPAQIKALTAEITDIAKKLIDRFFPGPLTVVLRRSDKVSTVATAGLDTIAVRMPSHKLAQSLITECGTPLVAPSANLSGRPSPTTWQAVFEDLDGGIDCILLGEPTEIGLESTVVDCTGDIPIVLRPGAVSLDELEAVVRETRMGIASDNQEPRSPGIKHQHYAPRAVVRIVEARFQPPNLRSAFIGISRPEQEVEVVRICSSVGEYAHELFEFFRECDRSGIEAIYCERVPEEGLGTALMDRLGRAASRQ